MLGAVAVGTLLEAVNGQFDIDLATTCKIHTP